MNETIKANVIGAIVAAIVIAIGAAAIQTISGGGLVRVLGGATTQDLQRLRVVDWGRSERFGLYQGGEQNVPSLPENILSGHPNPPPHTQQMIPVSEGVCFLTDIRGNFNGDLERVYIEDVDGYWHLRAYTKRGGMRVFATCWRFFTPSL